jgi:glycosyltransferase involved in cell wall biosynthesis
MITILMATHNGSHTLPVVLDAYCKLESLNEDWKIVIVDNASTDSTKDIVRSFQAKLPITYVQEPRIGKNFALNTGVEYIAGDLALLTDDDAVPQRDWLVQTRRIAAAQPSFAIFGGVILPQWEAIPEDWLLEYVTCKYAVTNPSWAEGPIEPLWVYGPNMAIRSEVFQAGHRFDVKLGPRGSRYQQGDETEFLQRIGRAGFKCWHCKDMVVAHIIRKHQMTKQWLLRRAIPIGHAEFKREFGEFGERQLPVPLFGVARYLIRELIVQALRVARALIRGNEGDMLKERFRFNTLIGNALGSRELYTLKRSQNVPT